MAVTSLLDIKKDFPIFSGKRKRIVYLDSAATSQKPRAVIEAVKQYYEEMNANVHRGLHFLSEQATNAYEGARMKVAAFINAQLKEIVFVRNTTEAINLVARSYVCPKLKKGDRILLTEMEHHSNIVPWQMIAKEKGAVINYVPVTADGLLDIDAAKKLLTKKPKIFALAHVSNVLGTVNPVKELAAIAHKNGVMVLVDGAQSVPHLKIDVKDMDCDFFAFSGHKMFGPTGIGVLYGKKNLLEKMEPMLGGGDMIKEVTYKSATWNDLPWKFEAGTPNIEGAIGLGAAVDYINSVGIDLIKNHVETLVSYALEKLSKMSSIKAYGTRDINNRVGVISFNLGDMHAHDVATVLDEEGIAIRSGHHCAMPLLEKLGVHSAVRASFSIYNTFEDVDILIDGLERAEKVFKL